MTDAASPKPNRLIEAKRIFLEVESMGLADREEAVARACGSDTDLRTLVDLLLRGSDAPLPYESLAEDIRAANEMPTPPIESVGTWISALDAVSGATIKHDGSPGADRGDRVGPYRLLERLGEGGFGIVFMAEQEHPVRRRVALKIIKLGMDTKQIVARFEAERQALALMEHPCIARVFDAGATTSGRPYFVMELVRGLPITEYCDAKRLSIRERLALMTQVCDALHHAHQKGVIHRDIKPSNILVTTIGDRPIPKVIDFGIAKATSARLTEKTVFTEFRQMIGTPEYMSPEQAGDSNEDVDTRTDVYSAGVLLYELLTGSTPFDSQRLRSAAFGEMQRIIREENPPKPSTKLTRNPAAITDIASARATPPSRLGAELRGELDWIVMKALEKDRARRYDSAGSMKLDLDRFLSGQAIHAAPPSQLYLASKFVKRHRVIVIAGVLLTLAINGGLVGSLIGFWNAEQRRLEAEANRQRADDNASRAEREKSRADTEATEARAAQTRAEQLAYIANLGAALTDLNSGHPSQARTRLAACPPSLRGWEWNYASSRLDTSVRVITPADVPGIVSHCIDCSPDGASYVTPYVVNETHQWGARIADAATDTTRKIILSDFRGAVTSAFFSHDGRRVVISARDGTIRVFDAESAERLLSIQVPAVVLYAAFSPSDDRIVSVDVDGGGRVFDAASGTPTGAPFPSSVYTVFGVPHSDAFLVTGGFDPPKIWRPTVSSKPEDTQFISLYRTHSNWAQPSTDGRLFACTTPTKTIQVVSLDTGALVSQMRGHLDSITSLGFNADNSRLISSSEDGSVRIWDVRTGDLLKLCLGHVGGVPYAAISPDGLTAYSVGNDGAIRVWNTSRSADGDLIPTSFNENVRSVSFSPDSSRFVATVVQIGAAIYETRTCRKIRDVDLSPTSKSLFTPDGSRILTARTTQTIHMWDAESGSEIYSIPDLPTNCYDITISPDGSRFAVALWDGTGRLYDAADGRLITVLEGFNQRGAGMCFSPDSSEFISCVTDSGIHAWRARDGRPLNMPSNNLGGFRTLAMVNEHVAIGARNDGIVVLWDPRTATVIRECPGHAGMASGALMLPDGSRLVSTARDGTLRFWDPTSGEEIATIRTTHANNQEVAVSPDGSTIIVTFEDHDADVFRLPLGSTRSSLPPR